LILVDTSVWIDHFRTSNGQLASALENRQVGVHPMVIGELVLGGISRERREDLTDLFAFEQVSERELLALVDHWELAGSGLGLVDAHLLASVRLNPGSTLWTNDRRLASWADRLDAAHP
jgi:predicted nucleic acid-binding protein